MKIAAVQSHTKSPSGIKRLSPVDYWRTVSPLLKLAETQGWEVDLIDGYESYDFFGYDLVWFSYMDNPVPIKYLEDNKIKWTVDFDDDFLNLSPFNPVKQQYPSGSNQLKTLIWLIKNAKHLTVSTNHLARVYSKYRDPKLPPPFVLENRVDLDFYKKREYKKHTGTVFSWQGGFTHHADIFHTPFWGAMTYILGKYPDTKLKILGGIPDDFYREMPQVECFEGTSDYKDFAQNKLPEFYSDVDVALCPLEDNVFNDSKSSIKAQEALVNNIPVIASNVRPYQELASKLIGVDLVDTTRDWINALEKHIHSELVIDYSKEVKKVALPTYVDRHAEYIKAVVNDKPIYTQPKLNILKKKLSIVLSCLKFSDLTGSELYTYELARALKSLDHTVTIVSNCSGEMKERAENEGIECVDFPEVGSLSPDLIISSHFEPTSLLQKTFTCPIINVIHSENESLWPIEKPVVGCDHYVAIRDTIKNKVIKEGIHPDSVTEVMNPIDFDRFNKKNTSSNKTLLFIGPKDHLRKNVIEDIKSVAKEKGLDPVFVGRDQEIAPTWNTEEFTKNCEMVSSIYVGRTAIEGWVCGKAALIYDVDEKGEILSKFIVAPPKDIEKFNSINVAKEILKLV